MVQAVNYRNEQPDVLKHEKNFHWHSKQLFLQQILAALESNHSLSSSNTNELIRATIQCLGGPLHITALAVHTLCTLLELIPDGLEEDLVFLIAFTVLKFMDVPNHDEREVLACVLHALYKNSVAYRSGLRLLFGDTIIQPLRGLPLHQATPQILDVLHLIIQGFVVPLKSQHISFCYEYLAPLLTFYGLEKYYGSLFKCLSQVAISAPGIASKLASVTLQICQEPNQTTALLFDFALDLVTLLSEAEFYSFQVVLYQRITKFLKNSQFANVALRPFEDSSLCANIVSNSGIAKQFVVPALQNAIVACPDPTLSSRFISAMQIVSGQPTSWFVSM